MFDVAFERACRLCSGWSIGAVLAVAALAVTCAGNAAAQDEKVGVTAAVNPDATGTPPQRPTRTLSIGLDMIRNERIVTGPVGKTQLIFVDGSALTIGPNAELMLDEFVYDPEAGTGRLAMTATKGVFRVVGGKISKTEAITLKTPTATLGIRGGIATAEVGPNGFFGFLFGQKMTVDGTGADGQPTQQVVTRPGTGVPLGANGALGSPMPIPPEKMQAAMQAFEGEVGRSGGAPERPTDVRVAATELAGLGSNLPPEVVGAEPAAGGPGAPGTGLPPVPDSGVFGQDNLTNLAAGSSSGSTTPAPPTPTVIGTFGGRYKSTPGSGSAAGTAGDGSSSFDRPFTNGNLLSDNTFTVVVLGNTYSAPVNPNGGFLDYQNAMSPFGPITGTSFITANRDFLFFESTETSFSDERSFLFAGVATPASAIPTSGFGAWAIRRDFVAGSNLPFIPAAFGGNLSNTVVGPALVGFNAGGGVRPFLLASVAFAPGVNPGTASVSAASILLGGAGVSGPLTLDVEMRGSTRLADGSTYFFAGPAGFATDGAGNTTFGAAAPDYFVLESRSASGSRGITQSDPGFATASFFPNNVASSIAPTGIGASRSNVNFTGGNNGDGPVAPGFANGLTLTTFGSSTFPVFITGDVVSFATSATNNTVSAQFQVSAFGDYQLTFGGAGGGTRSAFIDDRNFAAREAASGNATGGDGFCCFTDFPSIQSYLVGGTPQMVAPLLAGTGATACTCSFLRWGFWGADFVSDTGSGPTRERVSLGQWVAGNVPSAATVAGVAGSATYTGHAIADVKNGAAIYKAGGGFSMSYNFGSSQFGSVFITNLDGANYSGTVARGVVGYENTPGGTISGTRGATPLTGLMSLRFFSGPASPVQGVGGNFNAQDSGSNYVVRGIAVGQQ